MSTNNPRRRFARRSLWILLVLGLLGFGLSLESYRELRSSQEGKGTWCSFSELSDCEKAFQSPYSQLWGRPISIYGAATYFLVISIAALGLINGGPFILSSLLHLALLGIILFGATGYFGWALFTQVKTLCVLCISDYVVNLSTAIVAWRACWKLDLPYKQLFRWDFRTLFGSTGNTIRTALMVTLFVVFGFVLVHQERQWYLYKRGIKDIMNDQVQRIQTPWAQAFPTKGPEDAPIQVVMFGDHQCPYCMAMKKNWNDIMEEYPGLIRMTAVLSPSNTDCNPAAIDNKHHLFSCPAAHLAQVVYQKKGNEAFWKLQDELYANGLVLDEDLLTYLAKKEFGLSDETILDTWKKARTPEGLERHFQAANLVGVSYLPYMIIDGIKTSGYLEKWALIELLKSELEKKGLKLSDFKADKT
ncbi:MAG: thioredoxin domain-containing protein [Candidatus Omnitrophica bacterium]|nr:thioredoxin domain-containing protein [Candidatus Omnitrophota bacterium]